MTDTKELIRKVKTKEITKEQFSNELKNLNEDEFDQILRENLSDSMYKRIEDFIYGIARLLGMTEIDK